MGFPPNVIDSFSTLVPSFFGEFVFADGFGNGEFCDFKVVNPKPLSVTKSISLSVLFTIVYPGGELSDKYSKVNPLPI